MVILASVSGHRVEYILGVYHFITKQQQQIGQETDTQTLLWIKLRDMCNPNPKIYEKKKKTTKKPKTEREVN